MEKIKNEVWKELLGFDPGPEMKRSILETVKTTGRTLEAVCAEMALPEVLTAEDDGHFLYNGKLMTQTELEQAYPYTKFVLIKSK